MENCCGWNYNATELLHLSPTALCAGIINSNIIHVQSVSADEGWDKPGQIKTKRSHWCRESGLQSRWSKIIQTSNWRACLHSSLHRTFS